MKRWTRARSAVHIKTAKHQKVASESKDISPHVGKAVESIGARRRGWGSEDVEKPLKSMFDAASLGY